jgi:hypothetical protein
MGRRARHRDEPSGWPGPRAKACSCGRTTADELVRIAVRRAHHEPAPNDCPYCGSKLPKIPLPIFSRIGIHD